MYSPNDASDRNLSKMPAPIKGAARPVVLSLQRNLRLLPREICLISGAPRSGTTALWEWLGHQRGVAAFTESRILVGIHRFMNEIHRFRNLERDSAVIVNLARHLVYDYYSSSRVLIGKRLVLEKEPLEPIAFPSKDYQEFMANVRLIFPKATFLLVVRDPIATIWSMSRRTWGESLTDTASREFALEEYAENWCSCVDVIQRFMLDANTYIVPFGRLIRDPEGESRRILHFLNLRDGYVFRPRQTKEVSFSMSDREKILRLVQPHLEILTSLGISELS